MTIQRQYSLPNCKLVLEGWGDESESSATGFAETRPAMTILANAECHFSGQNQAISGDRAFLESLVTNTSQYAQQVLSGVPHAERRGQSASQVQLQQVSPYVHRLIVRSPDSESDQSHAKPEGEAVSSESPPDSTVQLDLSTVQLFDLVEAIDQMVADAQTLPDIAVQLTPVPKRKATSQEPVAERVIPAVIGISSLAAAAIALFFVPPPEFRPTEQEPTANEQVLDEEETDEALDETEPLPVTESDETEAAASEDEEANNTDTDAVTSPDSDADADSSSGSIASVNSDNSSASQAVSPENLPSEEEIEELFTQASPLNDRDLIQDITQDLRDRLDEEWDNEPTFDEPLEYRVGVLESGDIVGFSYPGDNRDMAIEFLDELPLLDLLTIPEDPDTLRDQTIAQVRVVFQPSGVIEVSPWYLIEE